MTDSKQDGAVNLINLVIARLKEDWPNYDVGSSHHSYHNGEFDNLFINHIPMGEVTNTLAVLWIPSIDGQEVAEMVVCQAADPKFFQQVCGTVKLIMQRHQEAADDALRGAQYFKPYDRRRQ